MSHTRRINKSVTSVLGEVGGIEYFFYLWNHQRTHLFFLLIMRNSSGKPQNTPTKKRKNGSAGAIHATPFLYP
jgi:hypothetical protein